MRNSLGHTGPEQSAESGSPRKRVLFLCTRNSARNLIAEALVRQIAGDRFEVLSAGLRSGEVHPLTRQVLEEKGIDTSELRSKGVETVMGRVGITYAIVVCEEAEAVPASTPRERDPVK